MNFSKVFLGIGLITSAVSVVRCGKLGLAPGMTALTFQGTTPRLLTQAKGIRNTVIEDRIEIPVLGKEGQERGKLTLTKASVVLKEIKFKKQESVHSSEEGFEHSSDDEAIRFRGPYVVDLLTNQVTPTPDPAKLPAGAYRKIELKFARAQASLPLTDETVRGRSIYLAGKYSGETASGIVSEVPFELSYELDESFEIKSKKSITIDDSLPNPIVVAFRMERWLKFNDTALNLAGVEFSEVSLTNGEIKLSKESEGKNRKVWEAIRRGIKLSMAHGKDSDDDGVLETEEGDDNGRAEFGDDNGNHIEVGDDNGNHIEVGDDIGSQIEVGDDNGKHQ